MDRFSGANGRAGTASFAKRSRAPGRAGSNPVTQTKIEKEFRLELLLNFRFGAYLCLASTQNPI